MTTGVLYSFRRCPYAIRARMALVCAGSNPEVREVVLRDKPAALLSASPKGTVPVLQLPNGRVLEESLDIMRFALSLHDPEQWLRNRDDDVLRDLLDANDGRFKHALDRTKYPERYPESDVKPTRECVVAHLHALDGRLAQARYLDGDTVGFHDAAIFPFVRQLAAVDPDDFMAGSWSHVQRWHAAMMVDPRFTRVMSKLQPWRSDAPPVYLLDVCGPA